MNRLTSPIISKLTHWANGVPYPRLFRRSSLKHEGDRWASIERHLFINKVLMAAIMVLVFIHMIQVFELYKWFY